MSAGREQLAPAGLQTDSKLSALTFQTPPPLGVVQFEPDYSRLAAADSPGAAAFHTPHHERPRFDSKAISEISR